MKRSARIVAALTLLAGLVIALTACGGSPSPSPSPRSGVRGVSLIVGGPVAATDRPAPSIGIAVHEGDLDGRVVARTTADANGQFTVDLKPGRYTVVQLSDAAMPSTVTVPSGQYVSVKLTIQAR